MTLLKIYAINERERETLSKKLDFKLRSIFVCLVFCGSFFVFVNSVSAATYYVSQVATNGYVIGNDSNNGLTKGASKLTIGSAITASSAGDTIYLNDGTYDYTTGVLNIGKGISLQAETDYGATITNNGSVAYMLGLQATITGTLTIGKIILTEKAANNRMVYVFSPTVKYSLVFDHTKFLDYYKVALFVGNTNTDVDLTVKDSIFNSSVMLGTGGNYYAIEADGVRNGNISIVRNSITHTTSVTGNSRSGVSVSKFGDNSTIDVSNNILTDNVNGGTLYGIVVGTTGLSNTSTLIASNSITQNSVSGTAYGVSVNSVTAASQPVIESNTIAQTGASSGLIQGIYSTNSNSTIRNNTLTGNVGVMLFEGIIADVNTTILCNQIKVYGNTITATSSAGYGILIGAESTGSRYTYLTNPQIYSNRVEFDDSVTTTAHGIMFGYVKYGLGWGNYSFGSNIDYLIKGSLDTIFNNNVAVNPTSTGLANSQALRLKGANNGQFINNTVIHASSTRSGSDISFSVDADTAPSTGQYKNNITYSMKTLWTSVNVSADGSSATFNNNDYYRTTGLSSSWLYAPDLTGTSSNPTFIDINISYVLASTSPLIDAGTSTGLTSTTTDYLGNPIYGTPDIGAYEYQPPFTIGTSLVDPTGNIRIYGNGKYRYTTATSSTMSTNLSVTPAETWSYEASTTRPEWLNISNITWGTTKQWTASSTTATTTIYTVGDLTPSTTYTITLDGSATTTITSSSCSDNICTANSEGKITFTYTGGYSTHTFAVSPYTAPIPTPTPAPASSSGSSAQNRIANLISMGLYNQAEQIVKQYNISLPSKTPTKTTFTRTLRQGMTGNDIKALQQFLNSKGFIVSKTGPGSPNNETNYFGPATKSAIMKLQLFYKKEILDFQNLKAPTGIFGEGTRKVVNGM